MSLEGVDYSDGRPGGAALAAAGKRFAVRYLKYRGITDPNKYLTAAELADLHGHGISAVANFESTSDRATLGRQAGISDGTDAKAAVNGLGFPATCPVYFSVDFNAQISDQPAIDAYLEGAATILGVARIGVYGSFAVCTRCRANGTATWFWQSEAWSSGHISTFAHIYQYLNSQRIAGSAVDLDRALRTNYGQFAAPGSAQPSEPVVRGFYLDDTKPVVTVTPKADPAIRMLQIATDALVPVPVDFKARTGHPAIIAPGIGVPPEIAGYLVTYHAGLVFLIASNVTAAPLPALDCSQAVQDAITADRLKARITYGL